MAEVFLIRSRGKRWCVLARCIRRDEVLSLFRYRPGIPTLNWWFLVCSPVLSKPDWCTWWSMNSGSSDQLLYHTGGFRRKNANLFQWTKQIDLERLNRLPQFDCFLWELAAKFIMATVFPSGCFQMSSTVIAYGNVVYNYSTGASGGHVLK